MRQSCYNHDTHALMKFYRGKCVIIHPSCMNSIGRLMTSSQSWGWDNSGEEPAVLAGGRDQIAFRWLPNDEAWKPTEGSLRVVFWRLFERKHFWRFMMFFLALLQGKPCDIAGSSCEGGTKVLQLLVLKFWWSKVDATCCTRGDTVLERLYPDLLWLQDQKQQQRPRVFFSPDVRLFKAFQGIW